MIVAVITRTGSRVEERIDLDNLTLIYAPSDFIFRINQEMFRMYVFSDMVRFAQQNNSPFEVGEEDSERIDEEISKIPTERLFTLLIRASSTHRAIRDMTRGSSSMVMTTTHYVRNPDPTRMTRRFTVKGPKGSPMLCRLIQHGDNSYLLTEYVLQSPRLPGLRCDSPDSIVGVISQILLIAKTEFAPYRCQIQIREEDPSGNIDETFVLPVTDPILRRIRDIFYDHVGLLPIEIVY